MFRRKRHEPSEETSSTEPPHPSSLPQARSTWASRAWIPVMAVLLTFYFYNLWQDFTAVKRWKYPACHQQPYEHKQHILRLSDFVQQGLQEAKDPQLWDSMPKHPTEESAPLTASFATHFALVNYFCGAAVANEVEPSNVTMTFTSNQLGILQQAIRQVPTRNVPQFVLRAFIFLGDPPVTAHTFIMHVTPQGELDLFQSYTGHYTLHSYLKQHRKPLTHKQSQKLVEHLQQLEQSVTWTQETDKLFNQNFGVKLLEDAEPEQKGGAAMLRFSWEIACITESCKGGYHSDMDTKRKILKAVKDKGLKEVLRPILLAADPKERFGDDN